MLEGRLSDYKRDLAEQVRPQLPGGEQLRVLALVQKRFRPGLQFVPYGIGVALILAGFFGDAVLPGWIGLVGAAVVLAGAVLSLRIERRLIARTDERVYEFALPSSSKAAVEPALRVYEVAELPAFNPEAGTPTLGGERIYPNYGAGGEQEAIAEALDPARH